MFSLSGVKCFKICIHKSVIKTKYFFFAEITEKQSQ